MKIVFVTAFFYPVKGGAENHVYFIAQELIKKGHTIEVWTSDLLRRGKASRQEEVINGIKVRRFRTWFRFGDFASFFPGVFRAVKNSDADIVHVHAYRHIFNLVPFFTNKPCILTLHWPNYPRGLRSGLLDAFVDLFDKYVGSRILQKYKILCAVSGHEIPWIRHFKTNRKIVLTPNCIPKEYFNAQNLLAFRKKYRISAGEIILLCVGRLHKSKGFDQVIKAVADLDNQKIRLVFVGKDEGSRKELEDLAEQLKTRAVFTGEVSEKEKLQAYAAASIFVHPSHYEAFGIVALEGMCFGLPVIVSNQGGLPWVVGDAGIIFKDNNIAELSSKIKLLAQNKNLRKELGNKAYQRAKQFIWGKTADVLEKEYLKLHSI